MHNWIAASSTSDLYRHRSVELLSDACRRHGDYAMYYKRGSRMYEPDNRYHRNSYGGGALWARSHDNLRHVGKSHSGTEKSSDHLRLPSRVRASHSYDNVHKCEHNGRVNGGYLDLPMISRSKSQGDVIYYQRQRSHSSSTCPPRKAYVTEPPKQNGHRKHSHQASNRSASDYNLATDTTLLLNKKSSRSWNCLRSPKGSSNDSSPEHESSINVVTTPPGEQCTQQSPTESETTYQSINSTTVLNSKQKHVATNRKSRKNGFASLREWFGLKKKDKKKGK